MQERLARLAFTLIVLAAAVCVAFLSTRYGFERDFSAGARSSLTDASVKLLGTLDAPLEVTSYARAGGGLRPLISEFIARYQRAKHNIDLHFVDPDSDPGAMRSEGVRIDGEIELHYHDRSERLRVLSESEFSSALLRLARSGEHVVAFLEGEGERQRLGKANADLGQFVAGLKEQGIRVVNLPLASNARVPQNTELLVVANPQVALAPATITALTDYIERGGNLLWLTEPGENVGLDPLATALSMHVLPGTVVDGNGEAFGLDDPSFVAINRYPDHAITRAFVLTTLFPQPAALAQLTNSQWKFNSLLKTSPKSWNETGHIPKAGEAAGNVRYDADAGEISGPLDLGFALSRTSPSPDKREQRAVVIGDGDFLSNSFLGNAGNRDFGMRLFNWLLNDDALIDVPERSAPDRELKLSQAQLNALSFALLIGLPLLLLVVGGTIVWRRRRR
ncbi:MAG: DUF4350 domain-containing protein [Dokdonella sp.]